MGLRDHKSSGPENDSWAFLKFANTEDVRRIVRENVVAWFWLSAVSAAVFAGALLLFSDLALMEIGSLGLFDIAARVFSLDVAASSWYVIYIIPPACCTVLYLLRRRLHMRGSSLQLPGWIALTFAAVLLTVGIVEGPWWIGVFCMFAGAIVTPTLDDLSAAGHRNQLQSDGGEY